MDKRVLIITRNFPPLVGGMERLLWNVLKQLESEYACDVVGPRGCRSYLADVRSAIECPVAPLPAFLASSFINGFRAARRGYHCCIAGSGITAPTAALIAKYLKIPAITFVHGLDLVVANGPYQRLFIPAIKSSDIVIANSRPTARLARSKGVAPEKIKVLLPGVEMPGTAPDGLQLRRRYGLENKRILLSVGRLIPRKGLAEFLKFSFPAIVKACPDVVFLIIGSEPRRAIKKTGPVLDAVNAVIRDARLADHVLLLGSVDDATLEAAYTEADLFVFPLRAVDRDMEGFGMVAVEAAAHGLPTAAFANGGVTDAVAHDKSGFLIEPHDYAELARVTISYLSGSIKHITPETCRRHAAGLSWNHFGARLRQIVGDPARA